MASNQSEIVKPAMFEGTDAVTRNRKVAVDRIVEVHEALEFKYQEEADGSRGSDSTSISSDTEFNMIDLPNSEVRAFRYFLRMWDDTELPDPEFDQAVKHSEPDFEEATIRHFIRRIALWNENEEVLQSTRKELKKRLRRNRKKEKDSVLGKLWLKERGRQDDNARDELKEVTTREGLAQLFWTLMHDQQKPLAPALFAECTEAVKAKCGITTT